MERYNGIAGNATQHAAYGRRWNCCLKLRLHLFDLLWIGCTTNRNKWSLSLIELVR